MKLENEFAVAAPIERTWEALLDVERVAGCLPGASVKRGASEGVYEGQMKVKLGPATVAYKGTLRMTDVDEARHRAVMQIQAKELKGSGEARARMSNQLVAEDKERTRVILGTELDISGRAAQLGGGMMESVAGRLLGDFARRLERDLTAAPNAGAVPADAPGAAPADGPGAARAGGSAPAAAGAGADVLDVGALIRPTIMQRDCAVALAAVIAVRVIDALAWRRRLRALESRIDRMARS